VLKRVVQEPVVPPRRRVARTPRALEAVCLKALAKQPEARYAKAKELADEAQRWLADEPVRAYRDPVVVRLGRWARKHRNTVAAGAALLQTAVVVLAISVLLIGRSRAQVDRQRQRAEAVNAFLTQDLLAQAEPEKNPASEKLTVRALLDRAAGALETSPTIEANPEVEASVRTTIGSSYLGLGLYQRAREQLERAVACQDQVRDLPARERIFTKNRLCWVVYKLGSFDETMAKEVLDQARARLGPDDEETIYAADTLATISLGNGNRKAFTLYRENLATQQRVHGPDHPLTVRAAANLADGLMSNQQGDIQNNLDEALRVMLASRDAARRPGADDLNALYFENALGFLYARMGKCAEAKEVLAPLLERFLKVLGPDHIDVALCRENLALAEEGLGHLDAAEKLLRQARDVRKDRLGDAHELTRRATVHLARVCLARGKADEGVAWLRVLMTAGVVRTGAGIALPANPAVPPRPAPADPPAPAPAAGPGGPADLGIPIRPAEVADINRLGDALAGKADWRTSVRLLNELQRTVEWLTWRTDWLRAYVLALRWEAQFRFAPHRESKDVVVGPKEVAVGAIKAALKTLEANPATPPRILEETRARLKRVTEADDRPLPAPPPRARPAGSPR
jgi:tetratricopeptide (TPR) repeat protein